VNCFAEAVTFRPPQLKSPLLRGTRPDSMPSAEIASYKPITNRGEPASISLRDEAPRKCGEFIGAGREFSFRDSPYTLCETAIGMI